MDRALHSGDSRRFSRKLRVSRRNGASIPAGSRELGRRRGSGESGARAQTLAAERDELQEREKVAQTLPARRAGAKVGERVRTLSSPFLAKHKTWRRALRGAYFFFEREREKETHGGPVRVSFLGLSL